MATSQVVLDQIPAGMLVVELPDLKITHIGMVDTEAQQIAKELLGATIKDYVARWPLYRPDGRRAPLEELAVYRAAHYGEVVRNEEWIAERPRGRIALSLNASPVRDTGGMIIGAVSTWFDITELKASQIKCQQALERNAMLLREVNHRVKNSLNIVASLLSVRARFAGNAEVRQALDEAEMRVRAVARLHDRLYRTEQFESVDFRDYLRALSEDIARVSTSASVLLKLDCGQRCFVPIDVVVPLGLILNELVTNATKHAFVGREPGIIEICFDVGEEGRATLSVADNGAGLPAGFDPDRAGSTGMRLVIQLVRQIHADMDITENHPGTRFTIRLPPGSALNAPAGEPSAN